MGRRASRICYGVIISLVGMSVLLVSGCAYDPGIPLVPVPLFPYAPDVQPIPEKKEVPLSTTALVNGKSGIRNVVLGMRCGRSLAIVPRKTDEELLKSLPSADLKLDLLRFYMAPGTYG